MSAEKIRTLAIAAAAALALFFPGGTEAMELPNVNVHGYIDLEYRQTTDDKFDVSSSDDPNLKNGAFDQHHFNLLFDTMVTPKLIVKGHIEMEHGLNPGAGASVELDYVFGEYIVSDQLIFRGGKMLTPYGLYNEIHDATPAYISVYIPETMYRARERGGFAFMPKWTTGLAANGELSEYFHQMGLDYIVYVGNGESRITTNENAEDDNPNKAIGGRVQFTGHNDVYQLGVSGYYGDKAVSSSVRALRHWTMIGHGILNVGALSVRGELAYSQLGDFEETAWHAQASYRMGKYTPYVRYQTIDPDLDVANDNWSTYIAGINVRLLDSLFLKVEWNHNDRQGANADIIDGEKEDYGEFRSALTLMF